jgi:hypothetical protein
MKASKFDSSDSDRLVFLGAGCEITTVLVWVVSDIADTGLQRFGQAYFLRFPLIVRVALDHTVVSIP